MLKLKETDSFQEGLHEFVKFVLLNTNVSSTAIPKEAYRESENCSICIHYNMYTCINYN